MSNVLDMRIASVLSRPRSTINTKVSATQSRQYTVFYPHFQPPSPLVLQRGMTTVMLRAGVVPILNLKVGLQIRA